MEENRQLEKLQLAAEEMRTGEIQPEGLVTVQEQSEKERSEKERSEKAQLEKALEVLRDFVCSLALEAGKVHEYGETLWQDIRNSTGLLRELAYYHDYGRFLCEHKVEGYTLADILVWQVDHFKLYMDRPEEMNRYRQPRLFLEALEIMTQMEKNPAPYIEKMRCETGQDILG